MNTALAWLLRLLISAGLGWSSWLYFKHFLLSPEKRRSLLWELDYIPFPFVAAIIWFILITVITTSFGRDESEK